MGVDQPGRGRPRPWQPRLAARTAYALHPALRARPLYRRLARAIERHPRAERWFTAGEQVVKERIFGCQMCGQCALPVTGYACPMSCPKRLRNGPCGGVSPDGRCEVYPDLTCVWVTAFERAEETGHGHDLDLLLRPADDRQTGRSSWLNYWQGRDEGLWADPAGAAGRPALAGRPASP
jgi:Methylene-tetrahydrofolate reductase C terminal